MIFKCVNEICRVSMFVGMTEVKSCPACWRVGVRLDDQNTIESLLAAMDKSVSSMQMPLWKGRDHAA